MVRDIHCELLWSSTVWCIGMYYSWLGGTHYLFHRFMNVLRSIFLQYPEWQQNRNCK